MNYDRLLQLGGVDREIPPVPGYISKEELQGEINGINVLIPEEASEDNQLADKAYVDGSVATNSAAYRGSYNLVSDLSLTTSATRSDISAALATAVSDAENAQTVYVQIPIADNAPSQIDHEERYKYNGTSWEYEYSPYISPVDGVFDISAYNNNTKYANLTEALGTNGANIPQELRRGGMSVKFVHNSDNKYVQYRLAAPYWSTDIHDWTSEDPYFIDKIMQEVNEAIDENTPIEIHGDVTNAPDEEDLTSVNIRGTDVLKFKDKAYNPLTYSGMGRKILRKNIVDGVNTLTQEMMSDANTIYIIQYDFTLGEDITVPANCVLEFDGGSISAGSGENMNTIIGNGTIIDAPIAKIFNSDVVLSKDIQSVGRYGSGWKVPYIFVEWFGAKGDGVNDDTISIQSAINNAHLINSGICRVRLLYDRVYKISDSIVIPSAMRFGGEVESENGAAGSFRPQIKQSNPNKDVIKLYDKKFNSNYITRLYICDLLISGSNKNANCGISYINRRAQVTDPLCGIGETTFDGLFIENCKFGIYIDTEENLNCSVKNVCNNSNNTVGIGAYIKIDGLYGFDFRDCYFMRTYIGGILIETKENSKPIEFYNCLIESCGNEYNLDDYNDYGCFGVHLKSTQGGGYINIINSYIESNCPCRAYGDGTTYTKYGYTESANPVESNVRYIYITNPDFKKTADIIIEGPDTNAPELNNTAIRANIKDCHISTNLQAISVVYNGVINYDSNRLFIPGRNIPVEKSIIKVFCGNLSVGRHISITVKDNNISGTKEYEAGINGIITTVVEVDGNPIRAGFDVDYPALNEKYFYKAGLSDVSYGENAVFYLKKSSANTGIGLPFSPANSIDNLIALIQRPNCKPIKCKIILLEDCHFSAASQQHFPAGIDYTFVSKEGRTFNITRANFEILNFYNSVVRFKNVNITLTGQVFVYARNCDVKYDTCNVALDNQANGILRAEGICKLTLNACTISLQNPGSDTTTMLNVRAGDNAIIFTMLSSCTNANDVKYIDDTSIATYGTFANKPDKIYIYNGFKYFCTDRQTVEGATDGIEIVHKGNNVWVDAFGRVVS